jgi:hypothetical protein
VLGTERSYYQQRLEQESAAAERAGSAEARQAHRDLAERYSHKLELLDSIASGTPYPAAEPPSGSEAA